VRRLKINYLVEAFLEGTQEQQNKPSGSPSQYGIFGDSAPRA
jgi:hypothetical protein